MKTARPSPRASCDSASAPPPTPNNPPRNGYWPQDEAAPSKYWLFILPADISFEPLVDQAKLRWRIERDYQELKQEVVLGHYVGRSWRGLHHHITLCIAAYAFLIAERASFPPQDPEQRADFRRVSFPPVSDPRAPPLHPERHLPNSIATLRRRIVVALVADLPRRPCCARAPIRGERQRL